MTETTPPRPSRIPTSALVALLVLAALLAAASLGVAAIALIGDRGPLPGVATDDAGDADGGAPDGSVDAPVAASTEPEGWRPWRVDERGRPLRWDPCTPIDLVVNPEGAYEGLRDDLEAAAERVREASGLDLRILGEADEDPAADRSLHQVDRYGERWAPVLVAAADPDGDHGLPLRETDRAIAAPVAVGPEGGQVFVSGQIVLNGQRDDVRPGEGDRADAGVALLLHELGHLLGLDHVDDPEQIMHPHPVPGPVGLGPGDLRGLAALGDGGCLEVPDPAPVEVEIER